MEDESMSLVNYVPSFARGTNLLLVHNDTSSLMYLSGLLEKYSFNVTTSDDASVAASMICNHEGQFKLVMAKVNLPGMDTLSFFNMLHEKDIPLIFILSGGFDDVTWKLLAKGSCYFLKEPVLLKDLKFVWQHVYRSKEAQIGNKENQTMMTTQCQAPGANGKRNRDDNNNCQQREKRAELSSTLMDFDNNNHNDKEKEERVQHKIGSTAKDRVWTPELHLKFTEAIAVLGDQKASPKTILHVMNVPRLTTRQVASHMQKYKSKIKRMQAICDSDLPPVDTSSNSSGRTKFPLQVESQIYLGLPATTASLNVSQNQNQFLVNYAETEESDANNLLKSPGNLSFTHEFLTELVRHATQSLEDVLMDQNQAATEYDEIIKILEEDCDTNNCLENGMNPSEVDQYTEMLREVLVNSSSPQDLDSSNRSRS